MKKSTLIISTLAVVFGCSNAYAGTFTYTTTESESTRIGGAGPDGTLGAATIAKGKSEAVNADGTKVTSTYTCVSMTQPSNARIFLAHTSCDVTASDGTFSLVAGCNPLNEDGSEMSCVGGMKGKTGAYAGKTGNLSQHSKNGKATGAGIWSD